VLEVYSGRHRAYSATEPINKKTVEQKVKSLCNIRKLFEIYDHEINISFWYIPVLMLQLTANDA
jgi:hypothetical protein